MHMYKFTEHIYIYICDSILGYLHFHSFFARVKYMSESNKAVWFCCYFRSFAPLTSVRVCTKHLVVSGMCLFSWFWRWIVPSLGQLCRTAKDLDTQKSQFRDKNASCKCTCLLSHCSRWHQHNHMLWPTF